MNDYYAIITGCDYGFQASTRDVWKESEHKRRWERRYGKPSPYIIGTKGAWRSVNFIGYDSKADRL